MNDKRARALIWYSGQFMSQLSVWRNRIASLPEVLLFSRFPIDSRTIFHATDRSFAFTNLKPVIPGHVLVSPIRVVDRLSNLSLEEVEDLFRCARLVGDAVLKAHPHADSLTLTIQDGPSAGQTVKHLHIHIMPRWRTDRFNSSKGGNDAIYAEIDAREAQHGAQDRVKVDEELAEPPRTREDMVSEGMYLRGLVEDLISKSDISD